MFNMRFVLPCLLVVICCFVCCSSLNCGQYNSSCSKCVESTKCYYCKSDGGCYHYDYTHLVTSFDHCSLSNARWKTCWLNIEAMIIGVSVLAVLFVIGVSCCCCWCNRKCRARALRRYERESQELERQADGRRVRSSERSTERAQKRNEIREKYGLAGSEEVPYNRLDEDNTSTNT